MRIHPLGPPTHRAVGCAFSVSLRLWAILEQVGRFSSPGVHWLLASFPTYILPVAPAVGYGVKSLQSCPTLCDPIDGSPPGSPVPGILQARTLEWVAMSFSNA